MERELVNNKIVLCGCHEYGFELIDYLMKKKINISYIVSLTPEQAIENNVSGYICLLYTSPSPRD